jgi:hypothetical protein
VWCAEIRQHATIHNARDKGNVAVVDPAGQQILGASAGEDLLAELAEGPDQLIAEPHIVDALVGAPAPAIAVAAGSTSGRRGFIAVPCCVSRYCYVTSLKPTTAK